MRNIALKLMYVGTAYRSWQVQKNAITVAETLERSLASVMSHPIKCTDAGRTNAGVYAETYTASLRTSSRIPCDRIPLAVNTRLSDNTMVVGAIEMFDGFNAIGSYLKGEYTYRIYSSHIRNAFYASRAWFYPKHLDETVVQRAASHFVGTHDFAAVRSVSTRIRTAVRVVHCSSIFRSGELIECRMCASDFLYNMVHATVGTCIYAVDGKFSPDDAPAIPESRNRIAARPTVPVEGLYMTKPWYQEDVLQLTLLPLCEPRGYSYACCTVVRHRRRHPLRHSVGLFGSEKIILLQGLHKRPFYLYRLCFCRTRSAKEHRAEDIDGSRPNAAPKPRKRPNRFVRFLASLATLVPMVGAATLVANCDKLNFDSIKRWFFYRTLAHSDSGQAESFHFVGDSSNTFAVMDGDLLVCFPNTIWLYPSSGQTFVNQAVSMTNPVISTAGDTVLVYDAGDWELSVYSGREEVFSLTQEDGQTLLSADVNQNGWLAVTGQENGHKGSATVYDNGYSSLVRFSLSNRSMMDVAAAPDSRSIALLTTGLTDGNFGSRVGLYRLGRTEEETGPGWTCPVDNNTILDLRWTNISIWALGESGLCIVSEDGTPPGSYNYGGRYLKASSLDGDGTVSLLLGKCWAGNTVELLATGASGELAAVPPVKEQVLSLSAAGQYTGVLTADRLDIYSQDLELYNILNGTQNAQKVLQRSDGSTMFTDSTTVRLYVPQ